MQVGVDHIILGASDLDRGIDWVEQRTGVRAAFGGVHPGRGTRNALLSLGPSCYLEIIAPDLQQPSVSWFTQIAGMKEPKLLTWAAHTPDLDALAHNVVAAGFAIDGPHDGARTRPDGKGLSWKLFHLEDSHGGLLPFFIEWGQGSIHPATDAPAGCNLDFFRLQSPHAPNLERICQALSIDVSVEPGEKTLMRARLSSPKGPVEITS